MPTARAGFVATLGGADDCLLTNAELRNEWALPEPKHSIFKPKAR